MVAGVNFDDRRTKPLLAATPSFLRSNFIQNNTLVYVLYFIFLKIKFQNNLELCKKIDSEINFCKSFFIIPEYKFRKVNFLHSGTHFEEQEITKKSKNK